MVRPRRDSTASVASGLSTRTVYSSFSLAASVFAATAPRPIAAQASVQIDATPAHAPTPSPLSPRGARTSFSSGPRAANPTLIRALHECYVAGRYRQLSSTMGLGLSSSLAPDTPSQENVARDRPSASREGRTRTNSSISATSPRAPTMRRRAPSMNLELRLKTVTDVRRLEWEIEAGATTTPLTRILPLLDRAAELGSLASMYRLAILYAYGVYRHHPPPKVTILGRDPQKAVHWTIRALHSALDAAESDASATGSKKNRSGKNKMETGNETRPPSQLDPIPTIFALTALLARVARSAHLYWPAIEPLCLHSGSSTDRRVPDHGQSVGHSQPRDSALGTSAHASDQGFPPQDSYQGSLKDSSSLSFGSPPTSSVFPDSNPSVTFPSVTPAPRPSGRKTDEDFFAAVALWDWLAPLIERLETFLRSLPSSPGTKGSKVKRGSSNHLVNSTNTPNPSSSSFGSSRSSSPQPSEQSDSDDVDSNPDDVEDEVQPGVAPSFTSACSPTASQTSIQQAHFIACLVKMRDWLIDLVAKDDARHQDDQQAHETSEEDEHLALDMDEEQVFLQSLAIPPAHRSASATSATTPPSPAYTPSSQALNPGQESQGHVRNAVQAVLDAGKELITFDGVARRKSNADHMEVPPTTPRLVTRTEGPKASNSGHSLDDTTESQIGSGTRDEVNGDSFSLSSDASSTEPLRPLRLAVGQLRTALASCVEEEKDEKADDQAGVHARVATGQSLTSDIDAARPSLPTQRPSFASQLSPPTVPTLLGQGQAGGRPSRKRVVSTPAGPIGRPDALSLKPVSSKAATGLFTPAITPTSTSKPTPTSTSKPTPTSFSSAFPSTLNPSSNATSDYWAEPQPGPSPSPTDQAAPRSQPGRQARATQRTSSHARPISLFLSPQSATLNHQTVPSRMSASHSLRSHLAPAPSKAAKADVSLPSGPSTRVHSGVSPATNALASTVRSHPARDSSSWTTPTTPSYHRKERAASGISSGSARSALSQISAQQLHGTSRDASRATRGAPSLSISSHAAMPAAHSERSVSRNEVRSRAISGLSPPASPFFPEANRSVPVPRTTRVQVQAQAQAQAQEVPDSSIDPSFEPEPESRRIPRPRTQSGASVASQGSNSASTTRTSTRTGPLGLLARPSGHSSSRPLAWRGSQLQSAPTVSLSGASSSAISLPNPLAQDDATKAHSRIPSDMP